MDTPSTASQAETTPGTIERVVLLDDDFVIRQIIKIVMADLSKLLQLDIRVYTSGNGVEGLGYIALSKPNILIVDSTLPKYSGRELIEFIASNPKYQTHDIRVIVLSDRKLPMKLPPNHVVINKEDPDFIRTLTKECADGFMLTNNKKPKHELNLGFFDRMKLNMSGRTIRMANRADLRMANISTRTNILLNGPAYVGWVLQQLAISFLMGLGNLFNDKLPDENLMQKRADLARFRVREYPTLATVFLTLFFIIFQTALLVAGGIVVFSVRIESVFADYNPEFNLDISKARFNPEKVEFKNGRIALRERTSIPVPGAVPGVGDSVPDARVTVPDESKRQGSLLSGLSTKAEVQADIYPYDNPEVIISTGGLDYSRLISITEVSSINPEPATSTRSITEIGLSIPPVAITYQLSPDGEHWYWYNLINGGWEQTSLGLGQSNVIQQVNHFLGDFDQQIAKSKQLWLKVYLHSDGATQVYLSAIKVNRVLDMVTTIEEPVAK